MRGGDVQVNANEVWGDNLIIDSKLSGPDDVLPLEDANEETRHSPTLVTWAQQMVNIPTAASTGFTHGLTQGHADGQLAYVSGMRAGQEYQSGHWTTSRHGDYHDAGHT